MARVLRFARPTATAVASAIGPASCHPRPNKKTSDPEAHAGTQLPDHRRACCSAATMPAPSSRSTPASSSPSWSTTTPAARPTWRRALLSRHIGRHIAGNPRIIVQNMGGAGGIVGTKYLGEIAPRDGTMLGYFTGSTQRYVSHSRALQRRLPHLRIHRGAAERPHPFHAHRRPARHQDRGRRHQRREHRGRRACSATGRRTWRCG